MPLNKVKGNMYDWVTHTWNTVKGACPHGCHYCYMKRFGEQKPVRFDEKELKTDLGKGNFIFVGSSCDMFAEKIPEMWVLDTISKCKSHPGNTYLFQTKNPDRIRIWCRNHSELISPNFIVGTTIESDRQYKEMGDAPPPLVRAKAIMVLAIRYKAMVTIEPIMDFDLDSMANIIEHINPFQVNIGANTNHKVKLPEPSAEKVKALIEAISPITTVKIKPNLKRITG